MKQILNYLLNKEWIMRIFIIFLSEEKKERIHIARLRNLLTFFGHDISNMTNDEIKEGVLKFREVVAKAGITKKEVENVFRAFANDR